jgi:tetratricopeptide (TPR) repeat protein
MLGLYHSHDVCLPTHNTWPIMPPPSRTPPNRLKSHGGAWLVGLALLLAPAAVAAKDGSAFHLRFEGAAIPGTDLRLELDGSLDGGLSVRRGKVRARVPVDLPYPEFLTGVSATATPTTVTVKAEANCEGPQTFTLSRARLEALLENAAAEALARAKQWEGAAAGFSRALAADPTLSEAATNLAVAQVHAQRAPDAVATLARAAEHDPIWVAWRLAADPDLTALAAAPALVKVYGAPVSHPSHRALDGKHVAFSPSRGLFAWGAADDELRIVDLASGVVEARLPYSHVRRSADAAARTLAALGFTELAATRDLDAVFGGIGLKVTFDVDQGTARVSRGGRVIGNARFKKPKGATTPPWVDPWAASIPGAVIVGAATNIGDGCGAWIYPRVLRILVPGAQ